MIKNTKNKLYKIQGSEAGNVIERNLTWDEAEVLLFEYIKHDKLEGCYTPFFYEIVEM